MRPQLMERQRHKLLGRINPARFLRENLCNLRRADKLSDFLIQGTVFLDIKITT